MKIRLAFLISTLDAGGAERQLINTVNNLSLDAYKIKIFVLKNRLKIASQLKPGIEVVVLDIQSYSNPLQILKAIKTISNYEPQILHSVMFASNLIARIYKIFYPNTKVINHIHGLGTWIRKQHILLDRLLLKWVDKILVVSKKSKSIRLNRERYPERKVDILYNSLDIASFQTEEKNGSRSSPIILGMACRLVELKRVDLAIKLVKALRSRGKQIILKVAGTGPEFEKLKKIGEDEGIAEHIQLLGFVDDMPGFFKEIDCLILCSRTEDMPLTIIEAFSAGLPVIAANIGGIPELFENTIGLLVDDFTTETDQIEAFLESVDWSQAKTQNYNFAKSNFDKHIHVAKLASIYDDLLTHA